MRLKIVAVIIILTNLVLTSCEDSLDLLSDDSRDAFVGNWSVSEESTRKSVPIFYEVSIEKSASDSTLVNINNFYGLDYNVSVEAVVLGSGITIHNQTESGITFEGSGNIAYNDKTIKWIYSADYNNGTIYQVKATYTKK